MSSLRFVLGRAGSGKSEYIIARAIETEQQGKNAVIIVPEQYSHEREMQILSRTGYICEKLYVTSFNRLAHKVISESGKIHKRLDSTVKAMLMSRALLRLGSKLAYFKNAGQQTGYIQLFLDAVSEFKKGRISPEDLSALTISVLCMQSTTKCCRQRCGILTMMLHCCPCCAQKMTISEIRLYT